MISNLAFVVILSVGIHQYKHKAEAHRVRRAGEDCPAPEDPTNGEANYMTLTPDSVVSYKCDKGFTLEGRKKRKCVDGEWNGKIPKCLSGDTAEKLCPDLKLTPSLKVIKGELTGNVAKDTVKFACDEGYKIKGKAVVKCNKKLKWKGKVPTCLPEKGNQGGSENGNFTMEHVIGTEDIQDINIVSLTGRCGGKTGLECRAWPLPGVPYGPCCSNWGWCGFTSAYCKCSICVDFRKKYKLPKVEKIQDAQDEKRITVDGDCRYSRGNQCRACRKEGWEYGPCCSIWGWCGATAEHCCVGCIDYSKMFKCPPGNNTEV